MFVSTARGLRFKSRTGLEFSASCDPICSLILLKNKVIQIHSCLVYSKFSFGYIMIFEIKVQINQHNNAI